MLAQEWAYQASGAVLQPKENTLSLQLSLCQIASTFLLSPLPRNIETLLNMIIPLDLFSFTANPILIQYV